jgi:hypothetical protein
MLTTLNPVYDSRKSFYGKASVLIEGNTKKLVSYSTTVATIEGTKATIHGFYSATTLRHIKDFLYQNGFEIGSKAELEKLYMN